MRLRKYGHGLGLACSLWRWHVLHPASATLTLVELVVHVVERSLDVTDGGVHVVQLAEVVVDLLDAGGLGLRGARAQVRADQPALHGVEKASLINFATRNNNDSTNANVDATNKQMQFQN